MTDGLQHGGQKTNKIMTEFIVILIYLIGCVVSYKVHKADLMKGATHVWTRDDRAFGLITSLYSWISVISLLLCKISESGDKPAKW